MNGGNHTKKKDQICLQGNTTKKKYFEGWYYKLVTADKKISFAIIVGICTEDAHAFIQVTENISHRSYYCRYPIDKIKFNDEPFSIELDGNYFSKDQLILNLSNEEIHLKTNLFFSELTPYQPTFLSPTIMGPFSYLPMKCSHGIMSMHHYIDGYFSYQGNEIDFEDGYGYSEKDYGTSFPRNYLWAQTNTLKKESRDIRKISMMLAIADIPFGIFSFQGFLCVLQLGTRQYKFTTYNHSKLTSYREKQNEVTILEFDKGNYHLIVRLKPGKKNQLKAPLGGKMRTNVEESLDGTMSITLKKGSKVLVKQQLVACAIEKYTNKNRI